ncbi:MAG: hypothetical protein ACT4P5_09470 [Armatimonadota bacterium]
MRRYPWLVGMMATLLLVVPVVGAHAQQGDDKDIQSYRQESTAHCFQPHLVIGSIVIVGGRCYNFYLMRDVSGVYLGLGPGGRPVVTPGQVVGLTSSLGSRARGLLQYLIPLAVNSPIPMGTIQFAPVQVRVQGRYYVVSVPQRGGGRIELPLEQR